MARLLDKFFDEHAVVAKAVFGLIAARGEALQRLLVIERHAQALATAARAGFDHHGVANAARNLHRELGGFNRIVYTRNAIHARRARQLLRFDLVTHGGNRVVLGADEHNALFLHPLGKGRVLAQKPVARMHRLRAGLFAGRNDFVGQQIALA